LGKPPQKKRLRGHIDSIPKPAEFHGWDKQVQHLHRIMHECPLDDRSPRRNNSPAMRIRSITLAAMLAATAALSACSSEPETITGKDTDDMKNELASAPPVELPPAVAASKTYRCADASLVYVDFFADNKSANLRTEKTGTPTKVAALEAGQAMTAEGGFSLSGSGEKVDITVPGKSSQSCKA